MGKDTVKSSGNDRNYERDEFDVIIDGMESIHKNHSKHIASLFLIGLLLSSVALFSPYSVYAAGETLDIFSSTPNIVMPSTTSTAKEVTLTFTRSNNWASGTNSFTFDTFTSNPDITFYVDNVGDATDQLIGTTVDFGNDGTLTKNVVLKILTTGSAFGNSQIYIDAVDVSTGVGGDTLYEFFNIDVTVGDSSTPLITMNVTTAEIGDTIAINAHNFAISKTVTVTLTAPDGTTNNPTLTSSSTTTDSNGEWDGTFVIPESWADGVTEVKLSTSTGFSEEFLTIFSGGGGFLVSASPSTLNMSPPPDTDATAIFETMLISYSPYGGFSNDANFTINGLPPGVTSYWSTNSYTTNNTFSSSVPIANTTFSNVDVWFTSDETTAFGDYDITVVGTDTTDDSVFESIQATLSIPPPLATGSAQIQGSLSLSPSNADVGDTVNFSGNIGANLSDRAVALTLDGVTLTTLPASITTSFGTSTTFSGSFIVPSGSSGALEVDATLTDDNSNTISLKDTLSILSSTDSYTATISPENLPAIEPGNTSDVVTMTANGIAGKGSNTVDTCVWGLPSGVGVIFPDESSSIDLDNCSEEFTVPAGGTLSKSFKLKADSFAFPGPIMGSVDICNTSTWECKLFTLNGGISAPSGSGFANVFLSKNYAEAGDSLTVTASGYTGSETLTVSVLGNDITSKAASSGSATINLTLPTTLNPGFYPIKVTGGTSGTVAEAGLDVFSTSGSGASAFNIAVSPSSISPMQQSSIPNQNTNMTIIVDAFSGQAFANDEATVTIYGLPIGVEGAFKVNSVQGSYSNSPSVTLDVSPGGQNKTTLSFNVNSFAMTGPFYASIDVDSGTDYQFKDFSTSIIAPTGAGGMMNYFDGLESGDEGFVMQDLFSIGSVFVNPSAFMEGDTVTVTASGFNAGSEVNISLMDSVGSHLNITSAGTPVFDGAGSWSGSVSIPTTTNIVPGMTSLEVNDKLGRESETSVTILDASSSFSVSVSPTNIPPMSAGSNVDVIFIVKGLPGKDPGAVYLEFPSGIPYGLTGCFDTNNSGTTGIDCTNVNNFGDVPKSKLSPGLGGTSKTILTLDVDDFAQPGPVYLDIRAYTVSEGSSSTIYDVGDQEFYLPLDSNISPKSGYNGGVFGGDGGAGNFFGDSTGGFKDFSTMQSNFATQYSGVDNAFNAFTIAELFVSPTSGVAGDAISLTATGFQPGENVEEVYFGGTNMTIPKSQTFDASGQKTFNFKIPSSFTSSGYYGVEVCSLTGMCAFSDFYIVDANDTFNAFSTPSMLPPINAGQITDAATITVKSLSGKNAGTVTLSIDYLPHDVTACFGSTLDCDESSEFSSAPVSTTLTPAVGGTSSAKLRYNTDDYVPPGPKFVDVIVTSSENSQSQMLFVDFDVMGKQDFFDSGFTNMFTGGGDFAGGDFFNAYTIGSVSVKPSSGKAGDQITVTASGFSASTEITTLIFGDKTLPIPESANSTNTSGVFTTKLAVPTGLSNGFHPVDICAEDGMCAYTDFNAIDVNSKFTMELSQQFLPPFSAGEDSQQISVTLKATKGNDPGETDVKIQFLPPGVTAQFGSEGFSSNPSISLTTGVGGTNKTTLTFRADSYTPPGPLFAMIEAYPSSGTMQTVPIDSSIGSKSNFGGFMMGAESFMGDSSTGFKDFSSMQNDFMGTYGNDAFNAFTIADLYVNPSSGAVGSAVTLSATGFAPGVEISEIYFGSKNIPVPSGTTADASGSFSTTISVPTGLSGFQPIDLCTTNGMCAYSDFKISGANDVFMATASPSFIDPVSAGTDTKNSTITVKALKGKDPGTVTLSVDYMPWGVTARFNGSDSGEYSSNPTFTLTPGLGGVSSIPVDYRISETAPPGPVYVDIKVKSSTQSQILFVDTSVMPKNDFFDSSFTNQFTGDMFNAFSIASLIITPQSAGAGEQISLTASGFNPSATIDALYFGPKLLPLPSGSDTFDSNGMFTTKMAIPSGLSSGHYPVDLCTTDGMCAFFEIFVAGEDDLFTVTTSPQFLPPINVIDEAEFTNNFVTTPNGYSGTPEYITINSTLSVKAMSGKNAGNVTLTFDYLPSDITARFNKTLSDGNDTPWQGCDPTCPAVTLSVGTGGKNNTNVMFKAGPDAFPGPLFADVIATTDQGTQSLFVPIDSGIMPNNDFFETGFTNEFDGGAFDGMENLFKISSMNVIPSTGAPGDSIKISGSGFTANAGIDLLRIGSETITMPSGITFDSNGVYSVDLAIPTLSSGFWDVELCDTSFICSFSEIYVTGSSDLFTVTANPQYLESAFPGVTTNSSKITVKALSGTNAGNVTLTIFGLPSGITSNFDGTAANSATLAVGTGGKNSTTITFDIASTAPSGPVFVDIEATSDQGSQTFMLPIDFGVLPTSGLAFFDSTFKNNYDGFFPFKVGMVTTSSTAGGLNSSLTLSAAGFAPGSTVDSLTFGNHTVALPSSGKTFDDSGSKKWAFKVPNKIESGFHFIDVCTTDFMCAGTEFFVTSSSDVFEIKVSPKELPPGKQGEDSESITITAEALSGKDAGTVTIDLSGLPSGITSKFDGTAATSKELTVGYGGKASTKLQFSIADTVSPGPVFVDITASSSAGSQTYYKSFDFGVMPDFDAGGTLATFVDNIPAGDFNPFSFGSLLISPTAGPINGTVKLTASGFTPSTAINGPQIIFGNHTLALLSSDSTFDASGMYSTSIATPNMVDGNYIVKICETNTICAESDFEVVSDSKTFSIDVSPKKLPPAIQGQAYTASDILSIVVKAIKGQTPGIVTVELFGVPDDVTTYLDIDDGNGFTSADKKSVTLGLGGKKTVKVKFAVDDFAAPNGIPIFVEVRNAAGTEITGKEVSFGVLPKATFSSSLGVGNVILEPETNATKNTVTITASGFTASDPITIFWGIDHDCDDGHCDKINLPTGTTFDANGFYSQTISIKNVTSFGVFPITVEDNSQREATTEFTVVEAGLKFSNKISAETVAPVSRGSETANSTLTISSLAGEDSDEVEVSFIGLPTGFTPIFDGTALTGSDTVSAEGGTALGKSFNPAFGNSNKTNIAFDTASTTIPGTYHIKVNVTDANQISTLHDLEVTVKPGGTAADDFAQLSLSSLSGIENSTLTVTGKGFTAANTVSMKFGTTDFSLPAGTVFDSAGKFSTTIKIPSSSVGDYPIILSDGVRSATETFSILGSSDKYAISISPSNLMIPPLTIGTDSEPIQFTISSSSGVDAGDVTFNLNYTSHPEIILKWNTTGTTSNTNRVNPGFGSSVDSQLVLNAPSGIVEGNGNVMINLDVSDGITTKYYSFETSIIPAAGELATCTVAPSKVAAGSAVTVYGSGFGSTKTVSIDSLKMAGTSSTLSFGETITTDGSGVFSGQFTIPVTINSVSLEGNYEFHISDSSGKSCHAEVFVIPDNPVIQTKVDSQSMISEAGGHINATLSVSTQNDLSGNLALLMTSLPPGVTANVTSSNGTIIANYHGLVNGTYSDPVSGFDDVMSFTPGSPQIFNVTFNIPETLPPGPYSIKLGANSTDQVRAESLTLQVTDKGKAGVSSFPSEGLTESQVSIEGSGFGASERISVKFDDLTNGTSGFTVNPSTIISTSTGKFNGTITIPTLDAGLYGIFAEGMTGSKNATSQFKITPNSKTFALEISPKQVNLKQGSTGTFDISLVPMSGFSSNVTLSLTGLPDGITSSFQPTALVDPLNGIASPVTLSISVPSTKAVSSYTFSITGTAEDSTIVTERANIKVQKKTGGNMGNPLDMEKDSDGHLLIVDAENCQIQKFGENGTFIDAYGSCGTGNLEFDFEHSSGDPDGGIDIDSDGNIYIADTGNDRVVKLNSTGGFVKTIGTAGAGAGQFASPVAIEIDSNDNLWVTDEGNGGKIVKYDADGTYGTLEISNDLTTPSSVTSNSTHLVVVDTADDEVKIYKTSDGNVLPKVTFGGNGSSTGQLYNPVDVEIDSSGNIFVVEEGNDRIQKFDDEGNYKALIENGTSATFNAPTAIVLDNDGYIHIANTNDNKLSKMDTAELVAGTGPLQSNSTLPAGATPIGTVAYSSTNSSGYVLTTDTEANTVKIYDDRGNAVDEAAINSPVGIAQNSTGFIFVAQNATNTIKILHPDGTDTGDELGADLNFGNLEGLTIDSSDNIVVVDKGHDSIDNAEIVKIDQNETVLLNVTGFTAPRDVAIDTSGNIYVTEANSGNVTKLDSTGTQVWSIGGNGTADGKFNEPSGIDIDAAGNVYIADTGNDRLQKIDSSGTVLNTFDASDGDGLSSPTGLAIKYDGTIIVAESIGDEIELIKTTANFETSYGNDTHGDFTVEAGPKEVVLKDTTTNSTVFEIKIQTDGVDKTKAVYVDFDVPVGVKLNNAASGNSTALGTGEQLKLTIDSVTGIATGNVTIARNSTLSTGLSELVMKTMVEDVDPISNSGVIYNHKNTTLNIIGTSSDTTIEKETSTAVTTAAITSTTPLNISADFDGTDADVKIVMNELTTDTDEPVTIETKNMVMEQTSLSISNSFSTDGLEHVGSNIINIEPSSKAATTDYDIKIPVPSTLPDGITEDSLKVTWFDDNNGDWVELPTTVSGGFATATVDHFSSFSLGGSKSSSSSGSSSSSSSSGSSSGGGGGGSGSGGLGDPIFGTTRSLTLYEITYDVCTDEEIRIIVGSDTSNIGVKLRSPIMGVTQAELDGELPNYSQVPNENVYVYVAPLHPDESYVRVEVDHMAGRSAMSTLKAVNIYGCEGSEIVNVPTAYAESSVNVVPQQEETSFKSVPINGGNFIESTFDKYDFNIWYLLNGGVSSVTVNEEMNMIGLELDGYADGPITLSLARSIIDSANDNFVIMTYPADLDDYSIVESTDSNVIVTFNPPANTEGIEIFGSTVVPEFGSIVLFVLIISILSVTVLFRQQTFRGLRI